MNNSLYDLNKRWFERSLRPFFRLDRLYLIHELEPLTLHVLSCLDINIRKMFSFSVIHCFSGPWLFSGNFMWFRSFNDGIHYRRDYWKELGFGLKIYLVLNSLLNFEERIPNFKTYDMITGYIPEYDDIIRKSNKLDFPLHFPCYVGSNVWSLEVQKPDGSSDLPFAFPSSVFLLSALRHCHELSPPCCTSGHILLCIKTTTD